MQVTIAVADGIPFQPQKSLVPFEIWKYCQSTRRVQAQVQQNPRVPRALWNDETASKKCAESPAAVVRLEPPTINAEVMSISQPR